MKQILKVMFAVVVGMSSVTFAGKEVFDFATEEGSASDGATAPEGWVYTSIGKSEGVAYFNSKSDVMASPIFDHIITNISIECKCSNAEAPRLLRIIPLTVTSDGVTTNDSMAVTFKATTSKICQFATFNPNIGINAFLIGLQQSGSGMWKVFSATVMHTGPEALEKPSGLHSESITSNSFKAVWNAAPAAESYALRLWQINDLDPTFEKYYYREFFSNLENPGKNPKGITDKLSESINPGWEGDFIYIPTNSQEIVQLGNTSNRGWLMSPEWTDADHTENLTLLIRACRPESKDKGNFMPVDIVRKNPNDPAELSTNSIGTVSLSHEFAYYNLPLTDFQIGDRFLFHSMTNRSEKRVIFDKIQVVSGFMPGIVTTNEIFFSEGLENTELTIETLENGATLEPGTYHWAVRADAAGNDGLWSDSVSVKITETTDENSDDDEDSPGGGDNSGDGDIPHDNDDEPAEPVDFSENAWRTSEMENGIEVADFSMVTDVKKGMPWENGISIHGIYYFKNDDYLKSDDEAKRQIKFDSRKSTAGGLYASYTNTIDGEIECFSLSLLGSKNDTHSIELPILNDDPAKRKLYAADIDFTVYQWTFKGEEAEERKLIAEWAVTADAMSHPLSSEWHLVENATFTTKPTLLEESSEPEEQPETGEQTSPGTQPETGEQTSPGTQPETGEQTSPGTQPETGEQTSPGTQPETGEQTSLDVQTSDEELTPPANQTSSEVPKQTKQKTHYEESKSFAINEVYVPHGGMLWLRWRTEKKANYPMIGINNLSVSVRFKKEPTSIHIR